jgi:WD40 repeat protein
VDEASGDGCIVRLLTTDGSRAGVGVLVGDQHILTCAHVVNVALGRPADTQDQPDQTVYVDFPLTGNPERLPARVVRWVPPPVLTRTGTPVRAGDDIAGLELTAGRPPEAAIRARLAVEPAQAGRRVRVYGCPADRPNGQWVNATIRERLASGQFQLDSDDPQLRIRQGFSGSPVYDTAIGRVVGVVAMAPRRPQEPDSAAIGTDKLRAAWPDILAGRQPRRSGKSREQLVIVHVSGTRFGAEDADQEADQEAESLARLPEDMASLGMRPDLLVVTGDLTEHGRHGEFDQAFAFLARLAEAAEIPRKHVAIVPGSRDVNHTLCRNYFAEQEDEGAEPLPPYFPKWKWFAQGMADFYNRADVFTPDEPWTLFTMPELSVVVAGVNSTMADTHLEQRGWVGDDQVDWCDNALTDRDGWLRLVAMRHCPVSGLADHLSFNESIREPNLLLHGSCDNPGLHQMPSGLPALSSGDATSQYQLVVVRPDGVVRYTRAYLRDRREWASGSGPERVSTHGGRLGDVFPFSYVRVTYPERQFDTCKGALETLFELVVEAARARLPGATITPKPDRRYIRVSRRLPGGSLEQYPVGVIGSPDSHTVDAFISGVHAEFKAADPHIPSVLVYGGPPASAQLIQHARKQGVTMHSFTEYQGLIDLRPLADNQREQLANDPLYPEHLYITQRYRIAARADRSETAIETGLLEQVTEWLGATGPRLVMVLGDFGRGKTAFLKQLTRTLPAELPGLLPILVELRGLEKAPTLEQLLVQYLASHVDDISLAKLEYMIRSGRIALLFDGFDELELRVGYDSAADYLRTMLESVTDRAKVVITSRTQHFMSTEQVRTALGDKVETLSTSRVVVLEDFTEDQITEFLTGFYVGDRRRALLRLDLLRQTGNLLDLARNPRMLSFVAALDEARLHAITDASDGQVSSAALYQEIIDYWLGVEEQRQLHPRGMESLRADERFAACIALARRMWESGEPTISLGELSAEVSATLTRLADLGYSAAHAAHAIGSGSLLVRTNDEKFRFIHQSIMEWLIAAAAATELESAGTSPILVTRRLSKLMASFCVDLTGQRTAAGWALRTLTGEREPESAKQNGAMFYSLLHAARAGDLTLAGVDLRHLDLNGWDLRGANMRGANLRGMHLLNVDLSGAILTEADLREVRMTSGSLARAALTGSRWDRTALLGVGGVDAAVPELAPAAIIGRDTPQLMLHNRAGAWCVAFSPDTDLPLLAIGSGSTVEIVDSGDGMVLRVLRGHSRSVQAVAFSPDGTLLATASADRTARLWDVQTGTTRTTLTGHTSSVLGIAFSPDGTLLATASHDQSARIWDVQTGTTRTTLTGHRAWLNSVAFSPDGTLLATASHDRTTRIWDVQTGTTRTTLTGHTSSVLGIAFSPDGTTLIATASDDRTTRIWDVQTGTTRTTLTGHILAVRGVAFSPDGTLLATASIDGTIRLWDVQTGTTRTILTRHDDAVSSVAFASDGTLLATTSADGTARLWDVQTGTTRTTTFIDHRTRLNAVAFSPDGTLFATASADSTARLWDTQTGTTRTILTGHDNWVNAVAFSPDGALLATASADDTARLWDTQTGTTRTILTGHDTRVNAVAFSPDGTLVATASDDGTARIWDTTTGTTRNTLTEHGDWVHAVAFSPDGALLATASEDRTARLWHMTDLTACTILAGHDDPVHAVAFSPDCGLLATGSYDATVRLWDTTDGIPLITLTGHDDPVVAVAFSPDSTLVATASYDGTARIWDVASGTQLVTLTALEDGGYATLLPGGKYKLAGQAGDKLWWAMKLCRFAPGELDAYTSLERLPADAPILSPHSCDLAPGRPD